MGDLADDIVSKLTQKFERHPVWVWYDAQEKYKGVVDEVEAALEDVNFARYDGSYLALKRRLRDEDPDFDEQWLFYIPASKNDAEWFQDVHALGRQYRVSADIDDTPAAQFLVEHEADIPDAYEDWGRNREHQRTAFFCVLFDTAGPDTDEWVRTYLTAPSEYREQIEEFAMADAWDAQLRDSYGIDAGLDPAEIATQLLFGELAGRAPTSRYDELAAEDRRAAAAFCDDWQRYAPTEFTRYAQEVSEERDLSQAVVDNGGLNWESTAFAGVDEGLIEFVLQRLAKETHTELPGIATDLQDTVRSRAESFWSAEEIVDWSVPLAAVEVLSSISNADTGDAPSYSPDELADRYVEEEGWWNVDAAYRRFIEATRDSTYPYPHEADVKGRVTDHYMSFLQTVNRPLADGLSDDPALATPLTEFADEFIAPEDGTAVIICDGLRYELAEEVRRTLGKRADFDQSLSAVSAALPSITEVGMAAHLPGQLGLDIEGEMLNVTVADEEIGKKSDRDDRFEVAGYEVVDLDDIGQKSLEDLKQGDPVPLVAYSGTIDKLGEGLDDDSAFSQVAGHVDDIERAVQRLKQAGYTKFVVTSDHGFLYTDRLSDDLKVDSPDLASIVKRRFAAADADAPLIASDEFVELDADALSEIGIDAPDLTLLFPRSVACFKAPGGNMRYFHGGISLQELLVPCLTVTTEEIDEAAAITYDVGIPDPITNSIVSIEVEAKSEQVSFDRTPTLEIRASIDGESVAEPAEAEIAPGQNSERVRLKQGAISGESEIQFELIDLETRETVERRSVGLDLLFDDDDMGFDV